MGERDRPKKSWRELDQAREKGRSGERPRDGRSPRDDARASSQHRAALDALFAKGELGKFADRLAPAARQPPRATVPEGDTKETTVKVADTAAPAVPAEDPRAQLRKKILEAPSRDAIGRAFDRYEKAYGMPRDFELLEQALEHTKDERILEVLGALGALLDKEKPRRSRTLAGKLRLLEETAGDLGLRDEAAKIRARLG